MKTQYAPSGTSRTESGTHQRVRALMERQHGVAHLHQILDCGLSRSGVARWLKNGRLVRIRHGVYALGHAALPLAAQLMAAALAVGADAAVSHQSAAFQWGLMRRAPAAIHVTCPRRHKALDSVNVHWSRVLSNRDVTRLSSIPITTVTRTILDLGENMSVQELTNVMHEASYRRRLNVRALGRAIDSGFGRHGITKVVAALELVTTGSAGTKSELELAFFRLLTGKRFQTRQTNVVVDVLDGSIEVDVLFELERLIVEVDGHGHRRLLTKLEDEDRDRRLIAAGYRLVRIPGWLIERRPQDVIRRVEHALTTIRAGALDQATRAT
ncbi:MAG: hypothetical protein JWM25_1692 [Thermoleophilia bacterium]|nr:hypothetical protein [Thermoleophilia bacterium]